jgi:signal transduction histidine kinase
MKKFLLLIVLSSTILLADGTALVLKSYSTDKDINLHHIENETSKFTIEKQDDKDDGFEITLINSEDNATIKQNTTHTFRWIMLKLDDNLSSGNYWVEHTDFDFTQSTFNENQFLDKFSLLGRKFFSFHYDKTKDSKRYFLKVLNARSHVVPMASLYTPQTFSMWSKHYSLKILLSFFLFGLIFMAAIYNGALYLYNRQKSFLYYMLMQFFMLGILLYQTDLINIYVMGHIEDEEIAIFFYFILVEVAIVFVILFMRSFLETKKYLPFHDKILHYIFIFALIDLVLFFVPIMLIFKLHSFMLLYILWIAWLRLRQGYKPALFFLLGWLALMVGVFVSDFVDEKYFFFEPILMGSTIEALFLAIAISYKMREIADEKETQKELLIHQSKLASMGEMLGNIAHQWRQPLTRLGYILMNIENKDKEAKHTQKLEEASMQLEFMSQTIDDFRDFYKPDKEKEPFGLVEETQKIISLLSLKGIDVELKAKEEVTIVNYKNEYKQVILNLLSNAKEVLLERATHAPKIVIDIDKEHITISDNAGGIKLNNIQKVFEPYFSTKAKGLGIGLYMSKVIVEKNMGGKLEVKNSEDGAVFSLSLI